MHFPCFWSGKKFRWDFKYTHDICSRQHIAYASCYMNSALPHEDGVVGIPQNKVQVVHDYADGKISFFGHLARQNWKA